jgi:ribosome-associated toxin RatA of RatAB toxin-antitoxin module
MLNYSDQYMIDLVFNKKDYSIFRRISLFTNPEWQFLFFIDSWQPWCISPRFYFYLGRVRLQIDFAMNSWLPPIHLRIAFSRYFKGVVFDFARRSWVNNLKVLFN